MKSTKIVKHKNSVSTSTFSMLACVDTLPQPPCKQILYSLVSEISKTGEGGGEVLFSPDPGMARTSSPEQDPGARLSTALCEISQCWETRMQNGRLNTVSRHKI